jgi:N-formylglutamate amidohydrolase
MTTMRQVVLHVPHNARFIPDAERSAILLEEAALGQELLAMTDAHTDALFPVTAAEAGRVVCPVSRVVCDVERFPDDAEEPMAARGMGVIYTRTSTGGTLRAPPDAGTREMIMQDWYRPHHRCLAEMVERVVTSTGQCLVIDCHSFASRPLPYEPDQSPHRADICIGTDSFHTPPMLRDALANAALTLGFTVSIDQPFAGALVPLTSYRRNRQVLALMVEVNRRLYMDEATGARRPEFANVSAALGTMIDAVSQKLPVTWTHDRPSPPLT